jgi:hypothetical protein
MVKRIGDLLVERGLLTPLELERALKAQLIFGGHLGTCLIELGFIDERTFGQALADLHGLRYATPELLNGIPPEVIERFPHEMAEKYRGVPIGGVEKKTLELAVVDPKSLDGLSKLTGCKILPHVAPEFRIAEALETYYGIQRSARCVRLCDRLLREERFPTRHPRGSEIAAPSVFHTATMGGNTATPEELGAEFGYGKSWRDLADDLFRFEERDDHDAEDAAASAAAAAESQAAAPGSGTVFERMSRADDRDQLARIVLGHAAANMERALLFSVKADTAAPWDWIGLDLPRAQTRSLRFPVTGTSIFSLMLGDGFYRGPVPAEPHHRFVYEALRTDVPREVLLLPVYLNDRLVAIVHGDGGFTGRIRGETESYVVLARRLGLALSMLVLKQKIRAEV